MLYFSKSDKGKEVVAFISGSVTFGLLIIVLAYHFLTEICLKTNHGRLLKQVVKYQFSKKGNEVFSNVNTFQESDERMASLTHSAPQGESDPINEDRDMLL